MRRSLKKTKKVFVIGVGNTLLKDEGAGVRAVEAFKEKYSLPPSVECVDGGTSGLTLLSYMKDPSSRVIIVDAVISDRSAGSISVINAKDVALKNHIKASAHAIGIADLIELARLEGGCPEITIIGIRPSDISPGLELTPVIKKKLPAALLAIKEALENLGVAARERAGKTERPCTRPL